MINSTLGSLATTGLALGGNAPWPRAFTPAQVGVCDFKRLTLPPYTSHVISLHSYTPISLIHLYTHLTMLRTTFLRSAAPSLRATTSRQAVIVPIAVRSVSTKQPTSASAPPPPALAGQFATGEEIDPQRTSAPLPLRLCR